jgi:hypothetical protein
MTWKPAIDRMSEMASTGDGSPSYVPLDWFEDFPPEMQEYLEEARKAVENHFECDECIDVIIENAVRCIPEALLKHDTSFRVLLHQTREQIIQVGMTLWQSDDSICHEKADMKYFRKLLQTYDDMPERLQKQQLEAYQKTTEAMARAEMDHGKHHSSSLTGRQEICADLMISNLATLWDQNIKTDARGGTITAQENTRNKTASHFQRYASEVLGVALELDCSLEFWSKRIAKRLRGLERTLNP